MQTPTIPSFHVSGGLWVEVDKARGRIRFRQEIRPSDMAGSGSCTSIVIELRVDEACDDWGSIDEFVRRALNGGQAAYRPTVVSPDAPHRGAAAGA